MINSGGSSVRRVSKRHRVFACRQSISATASVRARPRNGARQGTPLGRGHERRADFTGARLTGANFSDADLRKAKFECGAIESTKELSRASRSFSDFLDMEEPTICTQLQGAIFFDAKLQAASFIGAQLQRATSILRSCSMPTSWVRSYTRPTWQWRSCGVPTTPTTCAGAASFQISA